MSISFDDWRSRSPFYAKADLHFDTSLQPLEESFQALKKAWAAQN